MKFKTIATLALLSIYCCAFSGGVSIGAQSGIVIEAESGRVLWSKDADARMYPASTTKIMTALLFLENTEPSDMITAPADVEQVTGSSLYLKPGEQIRADDLAYAILLRSANDGCYAAAIHVAGSVEAFAEKMNARAKEIGCKTTRFVNPHGLHDPDHYTSARDLALIAQVAMKNEDFAKIAATESRAIWRSLNTEDILVTTHNKFLKKRDDATGIKTGWTVPAGRCFVGSADRDGLKIITVVLKSTDWLSDSEQLADWAFASFERKEVMKKGTVVATQAVAGGTRPNYRVALAESFYAVMGRGEDDPWLVDSQSLQNELPIRVGDEVGTVTMSDRRGHTMVMPVVAVDTVERQTMSLWLPVGIVLGLASVVGVRAYFVRKPYRAW